MHDFETEQRGAFKGMDRLQRSSCKLDLSVLIVDDEPVARVRLKYLCDRHPHLRLVGEADSGADAIRGISEERPDLVLLDVQLQDMTGFDVLRAVHNQPIPATIMVSVNPHHALQAYSTEAIDYLTKPVNQCRFEHAIERAQRQLLARRIISKELGAEPSSSFVASSECAIGTADSLRVVGESNHRMYLLEARSIDYIETDGNYVLIYVGVNRYISRNTLRSLENRFAQAGFVRINRSMLVNLHKMAFVERLGQAVFGFTLRNGQKLTSNRSRRRTILRRLQCDD